MPRNDTGGMPALASPRRRLARGRPAAPAADDCTLALMTIWAFFAGFGGCFVLSGLADSDPLAGLLGFAAVIAGFGAHILINRSFGRGFSVPQIALGLSAYTVAVLCFIAAALFDRAFTGTDLRIGIAGFGALAACGIGYVLISHGLRGSYAMLHRLHSQRRRAA